jgi:hypothetical protein
MSAFVHTTTHLDSGVSDRLPLTQSSRGAWPVASNAPAELARGNIQPRPKNGLITLTVRIDPVDHPCQHGWV